MTDARTASSGSTRPWFFTAMGAVALFAVCVGFGRTYAAPMLLGTFTGPNVLHIHGAFALAWVLLFLLQPLLIRWRSVALHRTLGLLGLPLALGVAVTMVPAGLFQVERDLAAGFGPEAVSGLLGVFTSGLLFTALVTAGIVARRQREAHARWMLLATLLVVWPAWFRFRHWFPWVPRPEFWFGVVIPMGWVVVAMVRDYRLRGVMHPVLAYAGMALIMEQAFELVAFDSPWWRAASEALYAWLRT